MCVTKFKFDQIRCQGYSLPISVRQKICSASRAKQGMGKAGQKNAERRQPRRGTRTEGCRNGEKKFGSRKSRTRGLLAQQYLAFSTV
jgi:hypothetical protein